MFLIKRFTQLKIKRERYKKDLIYRIFQCLARYFLLLGRPGVGYIMNAGYTLFKSEIANSRILRLNALFFLYFTDVGRHSAPCELAANGHYTHIPHCHSWMPLGNQTLHQ